MTETPARSEETAHAIELLLGGRGRDVEVGEYDFRRPRRLSPESRAGIQRSLDARVPVIAEALGAILGKAPSLRVDHVRETTADGLFDDVEQPLAALVLDVSGAPGWLLWENRAAVSAVETVLGGTSEDSQTRPLSSVEAKVLEKILTCLAVELAAPLQLPVEVGRIAQSPEGLGDWRDAEKPDAHRLEVALSFSGPGGESHLSLFLPGLRSDTVEHLALGASELPEHLNHVTVDVSARLRGCEVPLEQLLGLEKGDVIPIDARVGEAVYLTVEGLGIARASLGRRGEQLACRIEHLEPHPEELE